MIRTLIVEDDSDYAAALIQVLSDNSLFASPVHVSRLAAAKQALCDQDFDLVVLDLGLPDGNGLELIPLCDKTTAILVVSIFGDEDRVVSAIEQGAKGYVLKDEKDIVKAMIDTVNGYSPLSAPVAAHMVARFQDRGARQSDATQGTEALSPRESEILQALAEGLSYNESATRLGISAHTVADHIKRIYRKLQVNSRASAVYAGLRSGLVNVSDRK